MNPTLPTADVPAGSSSKPNGKRGANHAANAAHQSFPRVREAFRRFATVTAAAVGSPWAFALAVAAIIIWASLGPREKYSDTWQLVINTGTTIVTFLMVFLIQNTQNRDARAIHLKLDELIRGIHSARNKLIDLEDCSDEEIAQLEAEFRKYRERHQHHHRSRAAEPGAGSGAGSGNGKETTRPAVGGESPVETHGR
jgi:low affinity Fe/Cu permease